jgi:hypothetical protein
MGNNAAGASSGLQVQGGMGSTTPSQAAPLEAATPATLLADLLGIGQGVAVTHFMPMVQPMGMGIIAL